MARPWLDWYRKNWPRLGGLAGMAVLGGTALASSKTLSPRALAALNLVGLLVHQYEEYVDPGYFPGQMNAGLMHSDQPANYPLNTNTAMIINTSIGYPFYLAPVLAPRNKVLGLAPVTFGFAQALGHGVVFPKRSGARYSPGFLASALLHVPIGIAWIKSTNRTNRPLTRGDVAKGLAYQVAFSALGVALPNVLLRDRESPYHFNEHQVSHRPPRSA